MVVNYMLREKPRHMNQRVYSQNGIRKRVESILMNEAEKAIY